MSNDRFQQLLDKYLSEEIQPAEKQELQLMLNDSANLGRLEADIDEGLLQKLYEIEPGETSAAIINGHFREVLRKEPNKIAKRFGWLRYAAAILIVAGAGVAYLLTNHQSNNQTSTADTPLLQKDVLPGSDRAILTLGDGRTIMLDSTANGQIASQGAVQIIKSSNGRITYDLHGQANKEVMWNTMSTPKGGQYQVVLPDSTKVWLNASSSITFPTAFNSGNRMVKVKGEVYLEVSKNKEKPFMVDIDGKSVVEVLGTSFNINSYSDEGAIRTTLLEGSVRVRANESNVILKPGEQAQFYRAGRDGSSHSSSSQGSAGHEGIAVVSRVDLEQTLAWKNGLFSFNNADLRSVMRQLERWYDIKVLYEGAAPAVSLKGKMYRNVSLATVLEFLKKMGVNFRIEGKTVIVL